MSQALWPAFSPAVDPFRGDPVVFVEGKGSWLTDREGRRYLDGVGALEAMVLGHGNERLVEAARQQMSKLAFIDVFRYTTEPALELANTLARVCPLDDAKVHFTPGGSEAVETAMKVAMQYHRLNGQSNRRSFVSRHGSYHGVTFGAMSLGASYYSMRNSWYGEGGPGIPAPSGASDPATFGSASRHSSDASRIRQRIVELGSENVAGVVVDPMGTASGVTIPPDSDLRAIRELCDEFGICLIVDEVITGFGHTGELFASSHSGVQADIIAVSKGLSSGYMPIGATLVSGAIADAFVGRENYLAHGQTYGGHPVACAVALENIRILEEQRLPERAAEMGRYLFDRLDALRDKFDSLAFVRGKGLLLGLEIMKSASRGVDFENPAEAGTQFRFALRDQGLIGICIHPGNVLLLAPPLVVTRDDLDQLVAMMDAGLQRFESMGVS